MSWVGVFFFFSFYFVFAHTHTHGVGGMSLMGKGGRGEPRCGCARGFLAWGVKEVHIWRVAGMVEERGMEVR
jgi:hypothetical protein